jgi:hypothetical protein
MGRRARRRASAARRRRREDEQGRRVPVAARARADARCRAVHQRVQFPGVGPVGEGRAGAAVRRARHREARDCDGVAHAADGRRRDRLRPAARGRAVRDLRERRRAARTAPPVRRAVVHGLGADGRDGPRASDRRCELRAAEHRGRQPERRAADARCRGRQRGVRSCSSARSCARSRSSPARSARPSAARSCRNRCTKPPTRDRRSSPASAWATRGTSRCGWARSSAASSSTACSPASTNSSADALAARRPRAPLVDADAAVACVRGPDAARCDDPDSADVVHRVEVFGPVSTLMPYRDHRARPRADQARRRFARGLAVRRGPRDAGNSLRPISPRATAACTS